MLNKYNNILTEGKLIHKSRDTIDFLDPGGLMHVLLYPLEG